MLSVKKMCLEMRSARMQSIRAIMKKIYLLKCFLGTFQCFVLMNKLYQTYMNKL